MGMCAMVTCAFRVGMGTCCRCLQEAHTELALSCGAQFAASPKNGEIYQVRNMHSWECCNRCSTCSANVPCSEPARRAKALHTCNISCASHAHVQVTPTGVDLYATFMPSYIISDGIGYRTVTDVELQEYVAVSFEGRFMVGHFKPQ